MLECFSFIISLKFTERIFITMGDNAPPVIESDSWCRTTSGDKASTTFTWTIDDFFNRSEKSGEFVQSSTFTLSGPNDKVTKWELRLYPKGDDDYSRYARYIRGGLGLFLNSKNDSYEKVSLSLSILNERHQKKKTENMTTARYKELFHEQRRNVGLLLIGIEELRKNSQLLPNGNLTVVCDLTVFGPEATQAQSFQLTNV